MLRGESYVAFHDVDVTADGVDDVETLMFNDFECFNIWLSRLLIRMNFDESVKIINWYIITYV